MTLPGVVVLESDGKTLVNIGDRINGPGHGDDYRLRLTLQPGPRRSTSASSRMAKTMLTSRRRSSMRRESSLQALAG